MRGGFANLAGGLLKRGVGGFRCGVKGDVGVVELCAPKGESLTLRGSFLFPRAEVVLLEVRRDEGVVGWANGGLIAGELGPGAGRTGRDFEFLVEVYEPSEEGSEREVGASPEGSALRRR
jgi:hypothetical protein